MTPAAFTVQQAIAYLNVSKSHFYRHVRPFIKGANLAKPGSGKPMMRYPKDELDGFLKQRTK